MKNSPYKAEIYLAFNIVLALSMLLNSKLSTIYSLIIVAYGLYRIFAKKNTDGAAHIMAGYVIGIEVLFRMNSGGFGYEYGKYAAILFLVTGLIVGRTKKKTPVVYIVFILILIPSIMYVDYPTLDLTRQMVSFNLSGILPIRLEA